MAAADKYHIVVPGVFGSVYIAKLTKTPNLMSSDRRKVPEEEFIDAIIQYAIGKLEDGCSVLLITKGDKYIAQIQIIDKSLLK